MSPILNGIGRSSETYRALHRGKAMLLKVSGAEIASAEFPKLIEDIRWFTSQGIRILLVYGGGQQIDTHWGKWHKDPRPKIDGVGITDDEVMLHAVVPAHEEIGGRLERSLPRDSLMLWPADIQCAQERGRKYGLVGIPLNIVLPKKEDRQKIPVIAAGFVGIAGRAVNVNADDVARVMALQYREEISEVVFLTNTGGVLTNDPDDHGPIAVLTRSSIERILSDEHPRISAKDGMKKKLIEVQKILPHLGRVAIASIANFRDEIEKWKGAGTLCIDDNHIAIAPLKDEELPILQDVIAQYVQQGIFRKRSEQELQYIVDHHVVVRVDQSPLGGFSLLQRSQGWTELSALWSGALRCGIGRMLLDNALKHRNGRKMYALSTHEDAIQLFSSHPGFTPHGPLSRAKHYFGSAVPPYIENYATDERDPELFIAKV